MKRSSSPCSFLQEQTCPPCKLIYIIQTQKPSIQKQRFNYSNPKYKKKHNEKRSTRLKEDCDRHCDFLSKRHENRRRKLTLAEAPLGFLSTTWSMPFQSCVISVAALQSQTGAECPITSSPLLFFFHFKPQNSSQISKSGKNLSQPHLIGRAETVENLKMIRIGYVD